MLNTGPAGLNNYIESTMPEWARSPLLSPAGPKLTRSFGLSFSEFFMPGLAEGQKATSVAVSQSSFRQPEFDRSPCAHERRRDTRDWGCLTTSLEAQSWKLRPRLYGGAAPGLSINGRLGKGLRNTKNLWCSRAQTRPSLGCAKDGLMTGLSNDGA